MLHYLPNNAETAKLLQAALRILSDPENWCKGGMQRGSAYYIKGALYAARMPNNPIPEEQFSADLRYTRDDIKRGDLQESFWFLRQALKLCSDHRSVGRFNDAPATEHHQVIALIHLALRLVQDESEGITYTIKMPLRRPLLVINNGEANSTAVPFQDGAVDSQRGGRMTERPKVELVPVEADSDTQRVLE